MTKKKKLGLAAGVLLVLAFAAFFFARPISPSTGIAYRITGGKNDMVILGSIHIGSRDMYPLNEEIMQALGNAELLVFECDTQSEEAQRLTSSMIYQPKGQTLESMLTASQWQKLEQVAKKSNYDIQKWNLLKPWAVTSLLSMETLSAEMHTSNLSQAVAYGVESMVRRLANGKGYVWLETVQEQLNMFDEMSPALQIYLLESACDTILNHSSSDTAHWPVWWRNGDAAAFAASYQSGMLAVSQPELVQEYQQVLLTERNARMADRLQELLESESKEDCFVVIGLLHLVLENDSVLTLLQEKGYGIEKIASPFV